MSEQQAALRSHALALDPASPATVDELVALALAVSAANRTLHDRHRATTQFDVDAVTEDDQAIRILAWAEFADFDGTHWTPVELGVQQGTRALTLRTAAQHHDIPDGVEGSALAGAEIDWQRATYLAT
ncbi:MAG: hypothetical protein J7513_09460 [Solirubrobacteraceae bacterium]|nr:hypothetical protein [Solirubrobacteraceae bacterium]